MERFIEFNILGLIDWLFSKSKLKDIYKVCQSTYTKIWNEQSNDLLHFLINLENNFISLMSLFQKEIKFLESFVADSKPQSWQLCAVSRPYFANCSV